MGGDIVRRGHFFPGGVADPRPGVLELAAHILFWAVWLVRLSHRSGSDLYCGYGRHGQAHGWHWGHKVWQTFVLVALICGAAQIFAKTPMEGENFVEKAAYLYESGTKLKGGGLGGRLIGIPLLSFWKDAGCSARFFF